MFDDIIKRKKKKLTKDELKHLEEFRKYLVESILNSKEERKK